MSAVYLLSAAGINKLAWVNEEWEVVKYTNLPFSPRGVCVCNEIIYLTQSGMPLLHKYDSEGEFIETVAIPHVLYDISTIRGGIGGVAYNTQNLYYYNQEGEYVTIRILTNIVVGVGESSEGNIYAIGEAGIISLYNSEGEFLKSIGSGSLGYSLYTGVNKFICVGPLISFLTIYNYELEAIKSIDMGFEIRGIAEI